MGRQFFRTWTEDKPNRNVEKRRERKKKWRKREITPRPPRNYGGRSATTTLDSELIRKRERLKKKTRGALFRYYC